MPAVCSFDGKACLRGTYHFFSHSKVGVTASLVVEVAALIIGILSITHVLSGVGLITGATVTGTGGFFLVLTLALVCSRCFAKEKKATLENPSIVPSSTSQPSPEITKYSEQPILTSQSTLSTASWREKLAALKAQNPKALLPVSETSAEECLSTLSFLAHAGGLSNLFKKPISFVEPTSEKMKGLKKECENKKGEALYLSIAQTFFENLPILNAFIRDETQAVLLQNPTDETRNRFKLVNKQIRIVLLFLMSYEPQKSSFLKDYTNHLDHAFGKRQWNHVNFLQPCYYFNQLKSLNIGKEGKLSEFLSSFSIYRRHSLLHLFSDKIDSRSKCEDAALRTLLSATWFHGTRAVTSLSDTDFMLIPTGWLHQIGCTSFFGEMREGCQKEGVNANSLSGTYLDHVDWSINSYASGFQFDINKEIKTIEKFLEFSINTANDYFYNNFIQYYDTLPRIEVALNRWARWDQEAFNEKIPSLLQKLHHLTNVAELIEKKKPKEIFNWHDRYYSAKYESVCHSLKQIKALLAAPPPSLDTRAKK